MWKIEREKKQKLFTENALPFHFEFTFLSFEESDWYQNSANGWPEKYKDELYFQVEIQHFNEIEKIVTKFLNSIETSFVYIFLMNLNFGLIQVSKNDFLEQWKNIIEIDGDEVFCYNPLKGNFILVEKTEEIIDGQNKWIYEVTYSNKEVKNIIQNGV